MAGNLSRGYNGTETTLVGPMYACTLDIQVANIGFCKKKYTKSQFKVVDFYEILEFDVKLHRRIVEGGGGQTLLKLNRLETPYFSRNILYLVLRSGVSIIIFAYKSHR